MRKSKWQKKLEENVRTLEELEKYIDLQKSEKKLLQEVVKVHPMNITQYQLSLIDKNDPNDPIRKMLIPSVAELDTSGEYDTSGEKENTKSIGLQHKYRQTVLLLVTNYCAAFCRFCFRKRLVGLSQEEILKNFDKAVKYIKKHKEVNNVLLSGGDPLTLPTRILEKFIQQLCQIDHLNFIRIGTRTPVAFPDRILDDPELVRMLKKYSQKKRIIIVTHFNHPKEITPESTAVVKKFIQAGISVYNQTVLLKGVNDNPQVLADLMNILTIIGVIALYLFQCRPVKGINFQLFFHQACRIVNQAKKELNGPAKLFTYAMSHKTGKIEISGIFDDEIYFKYHQAKNPEDIGKIFTRKPGSYGWLEDEIF